MRLHLVPAYGRDYDSKKDLLADWEAGKDFRVHGGSYINKSDCLAEGIRSVNIRYKNATRVVPVDVR